MQSRVCSCQHSSDARRKGGGDQGARQRSQYQALKTWHHEILCRFRYKLIFEPQKTVSAKVGMIVEKSTGGRWRFELKLEATQPEVDGSVTIQAAPGQSALGPVLLYSPTQQPQPFTCHFTHDSSISFDVSPSEVKTL